MLYSNQQKEIRNDRLYFPVSIIGAVLFLLLAVMSATAQVHTTANHHTAAPVRPANFHPADPVRPVVQATSPVRPVAEQIILGEVVPFGNGTARSWVKKDADGKYTSLGITLTEDALKGLPSDVTPGLIWMVEYVLDLPSEAQLPFNHIGVNWNPKGHMPSGVYNVPHFDFHFYTTTPEQRTKITARGNDLELCRKAPAKGHVPEGYMFAPESEEPGMGGHWVDGGSHEFHGKDFTTTFIYGSYNGKVIFWEPMITKSYLESKPDVTIPLKLPQKYETTGYYPDSYSITFDESRKEYTVSFDGLTLRKSE
jgi:hypothetical protein